LRDKPRRTREEKEPHTREGGVSLQKKITKKKTTEKAEQLIYLNPYRRCAELAPQGKEEVGRILTGRKEKRGLRNSTKSGKEKGSLQQPNKGKRVERCIQKKEGGGQQLQAVPYRTWTGAKRPEEKKQQGGEKISIIAGKYPGRTKENQMAEKEAVGKRAAAKQRAFRYWRRELQNEKFVLRRL